MTYWFVFCKSDLLIERNDDGTYGVPTGDTPPTDVKSWTTIHNITPFDDGSAVKTYSIDLPVTGHPRYEMCGLRKSYQIIPFPLYQKAGKCEEILYWDQNTRYCGVCGAPMKLNTDISKKCTNCGKEVWPQLATAIIVLIHKGKDEVLLARGRNFKSDFYGLIAGFVETGETLEEAVCREVMEETGIRMVGFKADYVSGNIHLQHSELATGGWFRRDNLPHIPEKLSIARKLLDDWIDAGKE